MLYVLDAVVPDLKERPLTTDLNRAILKITIVADVAGRFTSQKHNADRITAAAICLPGGALETIRKRLPSDLPKWRDANDDHVNLVANIVLRESLGVGTFSIDKHTDKWDQFWIDASNLNAGLHGKVSSIKAAYQIKCLMYVQSTALAFISAVKAKSVVRSSSRHSHRMTSETLIFDNEIEGEHNIEVFRNIWTRMNSGQPLTEMLGFKRSFDDIRLLTEQEERLLMLPDYVAGIAHAAASQADVLATSQVSAECAKRTLRRFEQMPHYHLVCEPFALTLSEILNG